MTKNYYQEMMAELGFHSVDGISLGVVKGWPCSVELEKGRDSPIFQIRFVAGGQVKPCAKALAGQKQHFLRWYAEKNGENASLEWRLAAEVSPPSDFYAKGVLHGALAAAAAALKEAGLSPPETCPLCGLGRCDCWAFLGEGCRPVHGSCLKMRLNLPEQDSKTPFKVRGHYLTGVLGALLGAAVAALPNWAQALSKGTIDPILYVFIPFLAALVYRLFRGKARRGASGIIVLASSFAVAFVLELIWFWLVMTTQTGHNISMAHTTALYFEGHTLGTVLNEMSFSLLFLVLGFLPTTVLLRRYAASGKCGGRLRRGADFARKSAFTLADGAARPVQSPEEQGSDAEADLPAIPVKSTDTTEV